MKSDKMIPGSRQWQDQVQREDLYQGKDGRKKDEDKPLWIQVNNEAKAQEAAERRVLRLQQRGF